MAWKVSLPVMSKKAIYELLTISIEKGLVYNEKELIMYFVKKYNCWKNTFGEALSFTDGYGKEEFINTYI